MIRNGIKNHFREIRDRHIERHRRVDEIHRKIDELLKEEKEFQRYHKHNKYSQVSIILFNVLIWFLLFKFLGTSVLIVALAVIMSIGGIVQLIFHMKLEKRIFKPIEQLKAGVEEISKGNYAINVKCEVRSEISLLVDSFNAMAKKLREGEQLKAAYEENRKTLIANISHDLKTPITSIQGYIEAMLEREELPQESVRKYHQIIYNNAAYINKLIDDLFLFSKLDLQKLDLEVDKVEAGAFMNDLMEEFKIELEDRGVEFNYEDNLSEKCFINIDRKRVHQIFRNIIGNAVKYGIEGSIKIDAKLYRQEEFISIEIKDNGPGIPEDKLPHIFDRFYRVDCARTKDLMSTGLGLAIAKELTEAHNGRIKASSSVGAGTCFTIMLPIEK